MKNVKPSVEGDEPVIRMDLLKEFGPSASGKTIIVASTEGNIEVPEHPDFRLGLKVALINQLSM